MKHAIVLLLILLLSWPMTFAWAYPWDKDMVDQPTEKAQE